MYMCMYMYTYLSPIVPSLPPSPPTSTAISLFCLFPLPTSPLFLLPLPLNSYHHSLLTTLLSPPFPSPLPLSLKVINYNMPATVKHYIHRVGRTARAGCSGRSVTLVGESERKLLKEIVKKAKIPAKSRVIPQEVVVRYRDRIRKLEGDIKSILKEEQEEKEVRGRGL